MRSIQFFNIGKMNRPVEIQSVFDVCHYFVRMSRTGVISITLLLMLVPALHSQQRAASVLFKEESFDFGKIKESDGPVTHTFTFTNTGSVPLVIQNAQASCGCTTPEWTKQPVMPGAKGFIKATFDPVGRPGTFDKYVTVYSNADRPTITLKFNGIVMPKPLTVQDEFRASLGDLRLSGSYVYFGKLNPDSKKDSSLKVINTGKEPLNIKFVNVPNAIKVAAKPEVLQPGQKGSISISYYAEKKNDWGFLVDPFNLSLNGKTDPSYKITVSANIEENFSKLTAEQLANAPQAKFENTTYNFGTVKEGQKVEYDFMLKNEGKTDLLFRKFETTCGCTIVNTKDMKVKAGESSSLHVVFDTTGKKNVQNKTVTVVSNDPKNPRLTLWIKGSVE
jgi:hypothetical protein